MKKENLLLCEEVKQAKIKNIVVSNQYGKQYVFNQADNITIEIDGDTVKIKVIE